jgi:ATP:corrinoid adenosyltransferase
VFQADVIVQVKRMAVRALGRPIGYLRGLRLEVLQFLKAVLSSGERALEQVWEIVGEDQRMIKLLTERIQSE